MFLTQRKKQVRNKIYETTFADLLFIFLVLFSIKKNHGFTEEDKPSEKKLI